MENIKLNYAHLCDLAFLSQGGKANVIGIFKVIYSNQFPAIHPKFSVITSLTLDNLIGKHQQNLKIVEEEDGKKIGPIIDFNFEVNNKKQEVNLISDIVNIAFEKPGKYSLKIILDNKEIYTIPFEVIKS